MCIWMAAGEFVFCEDAHALCSFAARCKARCTFMLEAALAGTHHCRLFGSCLKLRLLRAGILLLCLFLLL